MDDVRRSKRATKFSGDYQKFADKDSDADDELPLEEEEVRKPKTPRASTGGKPGKRTKHCPGCGASVSLSLRECPHCDNQFSSKSLLVGLQSTLDESTSIRSKFPFEPEREDDGSLMIQAIIGRRPRKLGKKWPKDLSLLSAMDAKYEHEYLIKYKSMSYRHAQWLSLTEIEAMSPKAMLALNRYLVKIDKGDPTAIDGEGDIEPSYLELDRILDCREEEVMEIVDELIPTAETLTDSTSSSRLAAAILESRREDDALLGRTTRSHDAGAKAESDARSVEHVVPASAPATTGEDGEEEVEVAKSATQIFQGAERCRRVLQKFIEDPYAVGFVEPVDTDLFDDYLEVVGESICLMDVQTKLEAGDYSKYEGHRKFASDMRTIWRNCKLYNIYKSQIWHCAHYLSLMFERVYRSWVLSFTSGLVPLTDPIGRPWEGSCRVCLTEKDDDKVMLCDHCDASYHIYCLRPPLRSIPEGAWLCDHCASWISKMGAKPMSAAAEEEARLNMENAGSRKYIKVKRKKYLVKWRGLSYRECTWETAESINDDAKISEFESVSEALPDEPPLSQAEISAELDKNKKFQLLPAMHSANMAVDVYSTVVAQIRSLHFLKWHKPPTDALLKESGPSTLAFVYGYRTPMVVPKPVFNLVVRARSGDDENLPSPEKSKVLDNKAVWLHPSTKDDAFGEVVNVLSAIVYSVARGDHVPPVPELPANHIEVRVTLNPGDEGLHMSIGDFNGFCIVSGFKRTADGSVGPVERTNRVRLGDVLVTVNGVYVGGWELARVATAIKRCCSNPVVTFRFVRVYGQQTKANIGKHLLYFSQDNSSERPPMKRSLFFGVFPSTSNSNWWVAESYHNYSRNVIGEFESEEAAARAYDAYMREKMASENAPLVDLNFTENGSLSLPAFRLVRAVQLERREIAQKAAEFLDYDFDNDLDSLDSCDLDSDLEERPVVAPVRPVSSSHHARSSNMDTDSSAADSDDDESASSNASGWDSDNAHGEWKPKDPVEATGPMARLLKAVHESDVPPSRLDWTNYILELGMNKFVSEGHVVLVEQMEVESGETIKLWDSVPAAARALGISIHEILTAIKNRNEGVTAGGFRWRTLKTVSEEEEKVEDSAEESWKTKLYKVGREYRSGRTLRDYQVDGLNWLLKCWYNKRSSILADEMGLGKTVQVVAFLEHLFREEGIKGPFLVCVPLSTIEHWRREAEGWTMMTVCIYHDIGGGRDMRDVIREFEWYYKGRSRRLLKFHILITTYDDLIRDYEELAEVPWRVVVVDEAQRLRNANSKLIDCMRAVCAKGMALYGYQHRILMTGTPLQNNTSELWSLLNFIEPAKFADQEKFAERFGLIQTQEQVEALQRRIAPHILRRVKEDVAKDIPPKEETIIDVELTTMQKQYYRAIFEHNHGFLSQGFKGSNMPKLMNIQMELRKCCNHPFLINGVEEKEMESLDVALQTESLEEQRKGSSFDKHAYKKKRIEDFLIQTSGKMVLIDKLLPKLKSEGHKVLIFSQMVKMIDLIEEYCEFRRYRCERLDGRVSGNDRQKSIDRFNTDAESFVFLLSTRAGGVGINLTAADTVIIFDSDWNPQNDVQAMARCHRIGQLKSVTIYRLITRKSFEAEMFMRASKKLGLEQAILGSRQFDAEEYEENQKNSAKMDSKELEQLLREGAYAVLMDDNTEELKQFYDQDIDSILDKRTHVIREEKTLASAFNKAAGKHKDKVRKSAFTGESAMEFAEVDVNDPDFWKKVLPDLVTPDTMLQRLADPDMGVDEYEDEDGYVSRQSNVKKYFNDVSRMMEGILDLQRRGQLPERERAVCMKLLLQITLREEVFDYHQRAAAQEWLTVLEGTRRRPVKVMDKYQPLPIASEETAKRVKTKPSKSVRKSSGAASPVAKNSKRKHSAEEEEEDEEPDAFEDYLDIKPASKSKSGGSKKNRNIPESDRKRRIRSDVGKPRLKKGEEGSSAPAEKTSRPSKSKPVNEEEKEGGSDDEAGAPKKQKKSSSRKSSGGGSKKSKETLNLKKQILEGRGSQRVDPEPEDEFEGDLFDDDFE